MQIQHFYEQGKRVWSININRRNKISTWPNDYIRALMLGSIAIVVGIGLGMLCSKLFFQALSVILKIDKTLPLVWNSKAVLITAGVYFILFLILSLFSVWTVGRLQIIDLLREARKQKVEPFAFTWLCVVGIGCIIVAYVLSFQVTFMNFIILFYRL